MDRHSLADRLLKAAQEISLRSAESKSLEDLAQAGIEVICKYVGAQHGKLLRPTQDKPDRLSFWAGHSEVKDFWNERRILACNVPRGVIERQASQNLIPRSLAGHVIEPEAPESAIVIEDVGHPPSRFKEHFLNIGDASIGSECIVAIQYPSRSRVAVLCLSHPRVRYFSTDQIDEYIAFADMLGVILSWRSSSAPIEMEQEFSQALFQAKQANHSSNPYFRFDRILSVLSDHLGIEYCALYALTPYAEYIVRLGQSSEVIEPPAAFQWSGDRYAFWNDIAISQSSREAIQNAANRAVPIASDVPMVAIPIPDPFLDAMPRKAEKAFGFILLTAKDTAWVNANPAGEIRRVSAIRATVDAIQHVLHHMQVKVQHQAFKAAMRLTVNDLRGVQDVDKETYSVLHRLRRSVAALNPVFSAAGYHGAHVWLRLKTTGQFGGSYLRLVSPADKLKEGGDPYSLHLGKMRDTWVVDVYHSRITKYKYHKNIRNHKDVRYPELMPRNARCWVGHPILSGGAEYDNQQGDCRGVIACFDSGETSPMLSRLDFPSLELLSTLVQLVAEAETAALKDTDYRAVRSHEISMSLQLVQTNLDALVRAAEERIEDNAQSSSPHDYPVREPLITGPLAEEIRRIERTPAMLGDNIQDYMDYVRLVLNMEQVLKGTWKPNYEKVSIAKIVTRVVTMVRANLRRTGNPRSINILFDDFKGRIHTDSSATQAALLNILNNAVKYSLYDQTITIKQDPSNWRRILVCNTGIGILPEDEQHIFMPGIQGKNAKQRDDERGQLGVSLRSKGYGLYVARTIMRRLNGIVALVQGGGQQLSVDSIKETIFEMQFGVINNDA